VVRREGGREGGSGGGGGEGVREGSGGLYLAEIDLLDEAAD
jgi:hypothetical protein